MRSEPSEFGLTEDIVRARLEMSARAERELSAFNLPLQPQHRKEALRKRAYQEARSIADVVVNRLEIKHAGRDLIRFFPHRGQTNVAIVISLALGYQNKKMEVPREEASIEHLEGAVAASADIVDAVTAMLRAKLGPRP